MAGKYSTVVGFLYLTALILAVPLVSGDSAPTTDCTSVVMSMADCLSYVTKGSKITKPEGNCCSGLKSVLRTNAECLCEGFKSSKSFGVDLDMKKAMGLPAACHVNAPSADKCGLSLAPAGAPAGAPGPDAAAGSPGPDSPFSAVSGAPSSGGNEVAPTLSPGASAASVLGASISSAVFTLVAIFVFSSSF